MKAMILGGVAVACVSTVAIRSSGHDYDGMISRQPAEVRSKLAETLNPANSGYSVKDTYGSAGDLRIDLSDPNAIHARLFIDGKQASAVTLHFELAEGGQATHVTGDLDIDPERLAAAQRRAGNQTDIDETPVYLYKLGFGQTLQYLAQQLDRDGQIAGQPINFTLAQYGGPHLK